MAVATAAVYDLPARARVNQKRTFLAIQRKTARRSKHTTVLQKTVQKEITGQQKEM